MSGGHRTAISRTCQECGREFSALPKAVNKGGALFCCRECSYHSKRAPLHVYFTDRLGNPTASGCVPWIGPKSRWGYGVVNRNHTEYHKMPAHRLAWTLANGTIPSGLYVCHHCDNRICVNVEHLFLGTHDDNMQDGVIKRRFPRSLKCPGAKLSDDTVRLIRQLRERYTLAELADRFGTSCAHVCNIIAGKRRVYVK